MSSRSRNRPGSSPPRRGASLLALAVIFALGAGDDGEGVEEAFDSAYGQQYRAAQRSPAASDDVELAEELLSAAESSSSDRFRRHIYRKTYELLGEGAEAFPVAERALVRWFEAAPDQRRQIERDLLDLRRRWFRQSRRRQERAEVGAALVDLYLRIADRQIEQGRADRRTLDLYRRALSVAGRIGTERVEKLRRRSEAAAELSRAGLKADRLRQQVEVGAGASAVHSLVRLCLLELARPGEAAKLADRCEDEQLGRIAKLAAEAPDLEPAQWRQLGRWYRQRIDSSAGVARRIALRQAIACFENFLSERSGSDPDMTAGVEATLRKLRERLERDEAKPFERMLAGRLLGGSAAGEGEAPISPVRPAGGQGEKGTVVCRKLVVQGSAQGVSDRALVSGGPRGNGRSGARVLLVEAADDWTVLGTQWSGVYHRAGNARWLQLIHPTQDGHLMVTVFPDRVRLTEGGFWGGYTGRETGLEVQRSRAFERTFPLEPGVEYRITSELTADGVYRLYVDGQAVAAARIGQTQPLVLGGEFEDREAPETLSRGQAGVILGPADRAPNVLSEIRFFPLAAE